MNDSPSSKAVTNANTNTPSNSSQSTTEIEASESDDNSNMRSNNLLVSAVNQFNLRCNIEQEIDLFCNAAPDLNKLLVKDDNEHVQIDDSAENQVKNAR